MYGCILAYMYLCIYVSLYLCIYVSTYLCIYPSIHPSIHRSIDLSIYHLPILIIAPPTRWVELNLEEYFMISIGTCSFTSQFVIFCTVSLIGNGLVTPIKSRYTCLKP